MDHPPVSHGPEFVLARVLCFTGKGGVGKTSVAAATAVRAAARGTRVLLTSTDPAHSLADVLDTPLGDRPLTVADHLDAQQLDAQQRLERHWGTVRDYLVGVLAWGGIDDLAAEELVLLPGLEELFALFDVRAHATSGDYDLVVVDCAPTAETLHLLGLPDVLRWYADRLLASGHRLAQALRPLAALVAPVGGLPPVPDAAVRDRIVRLRRDVAAVRDVLTDTARTSMRLVVTPERLVVAEAERAATSLSLFGYGVDAVVVNRVLPDAVTDPYLATWRTRQDEHLARVRTSFAPTPVLEAPLLADEPIGRDALHVLGDHVYADRDERAVLHRQRPVAVEPDGDDRLLHIALPFATRDDLEVHHAGDALHVSVGATKRVVPLPAALRRREVTGARLADHRLVVRFAAPGPPTSTMAPPAAVPS